jgi:hypothetical protein
VKRAAAYIDEGDMWGFEAMNALNETSDDELSDQGGDDLYGSDNEVDNSDDEVSDDENGDDDKSDGSTSDEESPQKKKKSEKEEAKSMGEKIDQIWERRRTNLVHDFAIAGKYVHALWKQHYFHCTYLLFYHLFDRMDAQR